MATFSLLLVAVALGCMLFFSAVTAPLIFSRLEADRAAPLIRHVFSVYYPLLTGITAVAGVFAPRTWAAVVLALVAIGFLLAIFALSPALDRLRALDRTADLAAARRFDLLHRAGVVLNAAQMLALALVFIFVLNSLLA